MNKNQELLFLLNLLLVPPFSSCIPSLLEQGIVEVSFPPPTPTTKAEYIGFVHSAYAGTEVTITIKCPEHDEFSYNAQFLIRSSPCDKEFFDVMSAEKTDIYLQSYFDNMEGMITSSYGYTRFLSYKMPKAKTLRCEGGPDTVVLEGGAPGEKAKMEVRQVVKPEAENKPKSKKTKREASKKPSGQTSDATGHNGTVELEKPNALKTKAYTIGLDVDAIYLVVVKIDQVKGKNLKENLTVEVKWLGPQGYLGAIDWPLLPFYRTMCGVYGIFALAWLIVSACQWKDLLRVQFWIGAVILLGMVEKAVFYAECQSLNSNGISVEGAIQLAELVSCLKRTLSRMLVIVVSVGFGVVKPRLGSTLHKVVGVGFVYFILCAIEGIVRVSKAQPDAMKQKQLAGLPLTLLEVAIFWWIFTSLVNTMRSLRLRRNEVKLSLYRHFTNTLIFAVLASVCFMIWSLMMHTFTICLQDWKELWVDVAFWHLLFCVILLVIMILWRPTNNNQRYAFTPLLDSAEDEDEDDGDDTLFSGAFTTAEATKLRGGLTSTTKAENRKDRSKELDVSLEEELKWVEEHIPSSLADKALPALVDSDEEAQQTKFEISKMQ